VLDSEESAIAIWQIELARYATKSNYFHTLLSEDEKTRLRRFHTDQDRSCFVLSRGILRHLIGQFLNKSPQSLIFTYNPQGKPRLLSSKTLYFNLSHSRGYAIYVFSYDHKVGIDLEYQRVRCNIEGVTKRFFMKNEYYFIKNLIDKAKTAAFFDIWVQKEALLKALGWGLANFLSKVEVALPPAPMGWLNAGDFKFQANEWLLYPLPLIPNFSAALAVRAAGKPVKLLFHQTLDCFRNLS
jgi:4'-phosphopantetheinyl transferase